MLRLWLIMGVLFATALAAVPTAGSAPRDGTRFVLATSNNPNTRVYASTCPIFGGSTPDRTAPDGTQVTLKIKGWVGSVPDSPIATYDLEAKVRGAIFASNGDAYDVVGEFVESDSRPDVGDAFIGAGTLTVRGPGGSISGNATLYDLGSPPEVDLVFAPDSVCTPA